MQESSDEGEDDNDGRSTEKEVTLTVTQLWEGGRRERDEV